MKSVLINALKELGTPDAAMDYIGALDQRIEDLEGEVLRLNIVLTGERAIRTKEELKGLGNLVRCPLCGGACTFDISKNSCMSCHCHLSK